MEGHKKLIQFGSVDSSIFDSGWGGMEWSGMRWGVELKNHPIPTHCSPMPQIPIPLIFDLIRKCNGAWKMKIELKKKKGEREKKTSA